MSGKKSPRQQRRNKNVSRTGSGKSSSRHKKVSSHRKSASSKGPANRPGKPAKSSQNVAALDEDEPTIILLLNKPFQVLCQFTDEENRDTLANYVKIPNLYAAGRLDRDSEGLLLLTNNGMLQHRISHPDFKLAKKYLVQLEGDISGKALRQLCEGVKLKDGMTAPAEAIRVEPPEWLWPRNPPIRSRKEIPTSWIQITLTEGRNRQVRRMSAAVGYPTLRLIRTHIGEHSVHGLDSGEFREVTDTLA